MNDQTAEETRLLPGSRIAKALAIFLFTVAFTLVGFLILVELCFLPYIVRQRALDALAILDQASAATPFLLFFLGLPCASRAVPRRSKGKPVSLDSVMLLGVLVFILLSMTASALNHYLEWGLPLKWTVLGTSVGALAWLFYYTRNKRRFFLVWGVGNAVVLTGMVLVFLLTPASQHITT